MPPQTLTITKTLKWAVIGTNIYVFFQWRRPLPSKDPITNRPITPSSPGYSHYLAVQDRQRKHMLENYTLSLDNISAGRYYTVLTSAFSHASLSHLAVNMLLLSQATTIGAYIGLGPLRLSALALTSALGGSAGALYDYRARAAQGERGSHGMGASGMVQGMLVATACAVPRLPVMPFFLPVSVPYGAFVGAFLAWDLWSLVEERSGGGRKQNWMGQYVGYAAHLGGAVTGAMFWVVAMRRGRPNPFGR